LLAPFDEECVLSSDPEGDNRTRREDVIPRQGFLTTMPKRSLSRVVLLLAALAGIIYLRQRTGSIAGCMADAFRVSPAVEPTRSSAPVKVHVAPSPDPLERSH
jgi:hypothetical protein